MAVSAEAAPRTAHFDHGPLVVLVHLIFVDIDAVATKLLKGGVPFVSRGSLYFAIPGTAVTIQVHCTEPFLTFPHPVLTDA